MKNFSVCLLFSYINIQCIKAQDIIYLCFFKYQNIQHAECKEREHFHFHAQYHHHHIVPKLVVRPYDGVCVNVRFAPTPFLADIRRLRWLRFLLRVASSTRIVAYHGSIHNTKLCIFIEYFLI